MGADFALMHVFIMTVMYSFYLFPYSINISTLFFCSCTFFLRGNKVPRLL